MQTECSADLFGFVPVEGRAVVAAVDGGKSSLDFNSTDVTCVSNGKFTTFKNKLYNFWSESTIVSTITGKNGFTQTTCAAPAPRVAVGEYDVHEVDG